MTRFAIFVFALFMCGAMSVLNAQVEVPKEVRGDEDYINWWTYPSNVPGGASGFKVHPNGNIIANHDNEFFEINGETGELIRAFPVQYNHTGLTNVDISLDGKYFLYTLGGGIGEITYLIDYQSGKIKMQKSLGGSRVYFTADSKMLGVRPNVRGAIDFYDLEGNFINSHTFNNYEFAFSPDGKYILTLRFLGNEPDMNTSIDIYDAINYKHIKNLISMKTKKTISNIDFSPDEKYMGFRIDGIGNYIYRLSDMSLAAQYTNNLYYSFCLLENDLVGFNGVENGIIKFTLSNLTDTKHTSLFSLDSIGGVGIEFNEKLQSFIVLGSGLLSLNLEKILSKVGVKDIIKTPIQIEYKDRILTISNLNITNNGKLAKIIDLLGNVVFQTPKQVSQEGIQSIQLSLPIGAYILQIEGQSDSFKFLVTE